MFSIYPEDDDCIAERMDLGLSPCYANIIDSLTPILKWHNVALGCLRTVGLGFTRNTHLLMTACGDM